MLPKAAKKILLSITAFASLTFLIIWLWQRQPATQTEQVLSQQSQKMENQTPQPKNNQGEIPDNIVSNTENIRLTGKTIPKSFAVITSNSMSLVAPIDGNGNFEANIKLTGGLNLIDYLTISSDLKEI